MGSVNLVNEIGKIIEISMSKIKNIIAIKKKCVENGLRAEFIEENPHSNGVFFSRLIFDFFDRIVVNKNIILIIIIIMKIVVRILIILLNFNFLIGSQLYFLY